MPPNLQADKAGRSVARDEAQAAGKRARPMTRATHHSARPEAREAAVKPAKGAARKQAAALQVSEGRAAVIPRATRHTGKACPPEEAASPETRCVLSAILVACMRGRLLKATMRNPKGPSPILRHSQRKSSFQLSLPCMWLLSHLRVNRACKIQWHIHT